MRGRWDRRRPGPRAGLLQEEVGFRRKAGTTQDAGCEVRRRARWKVPETREGGDLGTVGA